MKKDIGTFIFGGIAGVIWSLIPAFMSDIIKTPVDLVIPGIAGTLAGMMAAVVTRYFYIKSDGIMAPLLLTPVVISISGFIFGLLLDVIGNVFTDSTVGRRLNGEMGFYSFGLTWIFLFYIFVPISAFTIYLQCLMYKKSV